MAKPVWRKRKWGKQQREERAVVILIEIFTGMFAIHVLAIDGMNSGVFEY
jgi:hypothetical protein